MNSRVIKTKTPEHYLQFVAAYRYKNMLIGLCVLVLVTQNTKQEVNNEGKVTINLHNERITLS